MHAVRRILATLFAATLLASLLTVATVGVAAADTFPPPINPGTGGGTPGGGGTGGGGSGGGNGGGGSGGSQGPRDGQPWSETRVYWNSRPQGSGASYPGMPGVLDKQGFNGDPRKRTATFSGQCNGEGCRTVQRGTYVAVQSGNAGFVTRQLQTFAAYQNIAWPRKVREAVFCAESVSMQAAGPYQNPDFPAQTVNLGTHLAPFAAQGRNNLNLCAGPYSASAQYINEKWGQYVGSGQGIARLCYRYRYTEPSQRRGWLPPEFDGCTNTTRQVSLVNVAWTQSCSHGNELGLQPRNFTGTACQGGPPNVNWTCGTNALAPPIINGTSNNAPMQIFHDGRNNSVSWAVPNPSGALSGIRDKRVAVNYVSGTPFRAGQAQSAPSQHFKASPHAFGANVANWNAGSTDPNRAQWNMQFFKAGMPGPLTGGADANLFRAQATFAFWADFEHVYRVVTGINFSTGEVYSQFRSVRSPASATCPSSMTALEVLRARNDN